tara:strand:- start:1878 stop:5921 length:4044 start_codon:yes stop_codon:yes gene_type:complete
MVKKVQYTYKGLNQDVTKSKHPFQFYYSANNIKIVATDTQSTGSITNEKGNELIMTLPSPCIDLDSNVINYGDKQLKFKDSVENPSEIREQINASNNSECDIANVLPVCSGLQAILGYTLSRDSVILFSTDSNGFDCIWELNNILKNTYDLELLYCRNLGFSIDNPIQAIFNFENEVIQKVYWVDGVQQLRFLNIKQSQDNGDLENIIDTRSSILNITGDYKLSQPMIDEVSTGSTHTAGVIQYTYNLYKLNGSQTTVSPVSELVELDFGTAGGGEINEVVGAAPVITISNLDTNFSNIKIYAIKYTSINEIPTVSVIYDQEIDNYTKLTYFDNGSIINTIDIAQLLFLGSNVFIPKHIQTKDNRMFASNLVDKSLDLDIDCRAYGHPNLGPAFVKDSDGTLYNITDSAYNLPPKNAAINSNYLTQIYQGDGNTLGGEGKYLKYEIVQKTLEAAGGAKYTRVFKDRELYRIGIEFYNKLGQKTPVKWISDLRTPTGNLEDKVNTLKVTLKPEFYTYIETLCLSSEEKPVGYKIVRADRTAQDRSILCQGPLTSMLTQSVNDVGSVGKYDPPGNPNVIAETKQIVRMPIITSRDLNRTGAISPLANYYRMNGDDPDPTYDDDGSEIFKEDSRDYKQQHTWQQTQMYQLYSPELLFDNNLTFSPNLRIKGIGVAEKSRMLMWVKGINVDSLNDEKNIKYDLINSSTYTGAIHTPNRGDGLDQYGWIGPMRYEDGDQPRQLNTRQFYHECRGVYTPANVNEGEAIYRTPEITERGQGPTDYAGDPNFQFKNNLAQFKTDDKKYGNGGARDDTGVRTINSYGARCLTIVPGAETVDFENRLTLEDMWKSIAPTQNKGIVIGEVAHPYDSLYTGNYYGGNSYESKSNTTYLQIGDYTDINVESIQINSPGDTYVQGFKVARLAKSDVLDFSSETYQITDTIEVQIESTINSLNRQDLSLKAWDAENQFSYDDYHKYNTVYSQQPTLIKNQSINFKFKKVNTFDTRVLASKVKIPGEEIDNFTDFLENEILDLDGKYGAINDLVNFRDELYTLQDTGVAKLLINPRVQVQATDGLSLELGKGTVLYDSQYLTTTSGSINKWGTVVSPTGFYYLDLINKTWNKSNGGSVSSLSDVAGLRTFLKNNLDYLDISTDNPLQASGVVGGFDLSNSSAYLTLLQKGNNQTVNFNELTNSFESFHDYYPSMYINKGHKLFTPSSNLATLWEHSKGAYQTFYGEYFPSYIVLQVNPEANLDCVFNNIEYKSEMYLNDLDQPGTTLSHLTAWNEYQTTNRIPLVLGRNKNLRRKFRNWQAQIPRQAGSRDRIRNPWIYLKLELDQTDDLKMILHDVIIHYTV